MARIIIKIGDVFQISPEEGRIKFFQYVENDATQLGSAIIRAFKQDYGADESIDLAMIAHGEIEFHAHCFLRLGINMECWTKAGKASIATGKAPLFRDTYDYGRAAWEEPILISSNWVVWCINQPFRTVKELRGEYQQAEIGMVMSPVDIVYRMHHGAYNLPFYPSSE